MAPCSANAVAALALAFAALSLHGCGPGPTPSPSPPPPTTTTTTTEGPAPAPPSPPAPTPPTPPVPRSVMQGIAYAPIPLKTAGTVPNDDFFCKQTESLWGSTGRGDLEIISSMGANTVRLYGNDPSQSHVEFLNEAKSLGLSVVAGISDYPYTQAPGNCMSKGFDCFEDIKAQYTSMLKTGFLDGKSYHTALSHIILINEPDLKLGRINETDKWLKAIVSAFDGVLDAEKDAGVNLAAGPSFSATFSYAICGTPCGDYGKDPGVGQMVKLKQAVEDPSTVGYTAKNDLMTAYKTRFVNSFNTANPSTDMKPQFLTPYQEYFAKKPVFIGEYHKPGTNIQTDMTNIMKISADSSNPLMGVSFFEFQVRYDKGGSELEFGMFGLGDKVVGQVVLAGKNYNVSCLFEVPDHVSGVSIAAAVSMAYGGKGVDPKRLCASGAQDNLVV